MLYRRDDNRIVEHRYEQADTAEMAQWWQRNIEEALLRAPADWMDTVLVKLAKGGVVRKISQS